MELFIMQNNDYDNDHLINNQKLGIREDYNYKTDCTNKFFQRHFHDDYEINICQLSDARYFRWRGNLDWGMRSVKTKSNSNSAFIIVFVAGWYQNYPVWSRVLWWVQFVNLCFWQLLNNTGGSNPSCISINYGITMNQYGNYRYWKDISSF